MNVNQGLKRLLILEGLLVLIAVGWRWQTTQRADAGRRDHWKQSHASWHPTSGKDRKRAIQSITRQLEAFKRDDYQDAVRYQSSNLKLNFATLHDFREMIKTRYPEFARYKAVEFGPAQTDPDGWRIRIFAQITGQNGTRVRAVYDLVQEADTYKVDGVYAHGIWRDPQPYGEF
jgi:hypothetical protein